MPRNELLVPTAGPLPPPQSPDRNSIWFSRRESGRFVTMFTKPPGVARP